MSAASNSNQFAVFELTIEATNNGSTLRWQVHRRYTDFTELHNKMFRSKFAGVPELPGKKMIGNHDPSFLETRRVQLEEYLSKLLDCAEAIASPGFMNFIGGTQFIDQRNSEAGMESFPYTFRSGRGIAVQGTKASDDTCHTPYLKCTIS